MTNFNFICTDDEDLCVVGDPIDSHESNKDDLDKAKEKKSSLEEARDAVEFIKEKLEKSKLESEEFTNVEKLIQLGFANREQNIKLLKVCGNDMNQVLEKLQNEYGVSWADKRH